MQVNAPIVLKVDGLEQSQVDSGKIIAQGLPVVRNLTNHKNMEK